MRSSEGKGEMEVEVLMQNAKKRQCKKVEVLDATVVMVAAVYTVTVVYACCVFDSEERVKLQAAQSLRPACQPVCSSQTHRGIDMSMPLQDSGRNSHLTQGYLALLLLTASGQLRTFCATPCTSKNHVRKALVSVPPKFLGCSMWLTNPLPLCKHKTVSVFLQLTPSLVVSNLVSTTPGYT